MRFLIPYLMVVSSWFGSGCAGFEAQSPLGERAGSSANSETDGSSALGGGTRVTPIDNGPVTAQRFMAGMKWGVNLERGAAWAIPGFADRNGEGYAYLKALGFTHVRLFYPWRPSLNMGGSAGPDVAPSQEEFARLIPSIRNAVGAGLKVIVDFCDVMGTEDFEGDRRRMVDAYLDMASRTVAAENFDPNLVAFGAVNEWAGGPVGAFDTGNNSTYNEHRRRVNAILRRHLPNHVLVTGPAYWKYHEQLTKPDFEMAGDTRIIYDVHAYDFNANDRNHWAGVGQRLANWSKANGNAVVLFGESGFGYQNADDPNSWVASIQAMNGTLDHVYPTMWAITMGGAWRMNRGERDYRLVPALEAAVRQVTGR